MEQMDAIVYCSVQYSMSGRFLQPSQALFLQLGFVKYCNANFVWILQYTWHMTISKVFVLNNMLYLAGEDS